MSKPVHPHVDRQVRVSPTSYVSPLHRPLASTYSHPVASLYVCQVIDASQEESVSLVSNSSPIVMDGSPVVASIEMALIPVPESDPHSTLKSSAAQTESGAPSPSVSVSAQSSSGKASALSPVPSPSVSVSSDASSGNASTAPSPWSVSFVPSSQQGKTCLTMYRETVLYGTQDEYLVS